MTIPEIEKLCRICYWGAAAASVLLAFFIIFVVFNRSPVIQYGGPGSIKIVSARTDQSEISTGEPVDICFSGLQWLRKCDTVIIEQLEYGGIVHNLPVHRVSPSPHANKCRAMGAFTFPENFHGQVTFNGTAISTCWPTDKIWPIETSLPEARFTVK